MYESLPEWDGIERMNHLFSDFLGSEQNEYNAYVGRMLLCSMVARAYEPGCIMRRMPVLEGPESAGKSSFVHDLGHPWSAEISSNIESAKQFEEDINGVFVAELMEMDALRKASASRIKAAISTRNARYRKAYGYVSEGHLRATVFVGTANPNKSINLFDWDDQNTRFFPVVIKEYNQSAFLAAKQQIFAESKAYFLARPNDWWKEPESIDESAATLRSDRARVDPWLHPIAEFLETQTHIEVSITQLLTDCLEIPTGKQNLQDSMRMGTILHALGWKVSASRRTKIGSGRIRMYSFSGSQEHP
jgi:putative DNA primase/helicase